MIHHNLHGIRTAAAAFAEMQETLVFRDPQVSEDDSDEEFWSEHVDDRLWVS